MLDVVVCLPEMEWAVAPLAKEERVLVASSWRKVHGASSKTLHPIAAGGISTSLFNGALTGPLKIDDVNPLVASVPSTSGSQKL